MKTTILITSICLLLIINFVKAQQYYFRHYQVENGLSNNIVFCSLQDSKGFLWFGTKDGLNRFDGYTFKVFHNGGDALSGLAFNFIYKLYEHNNIIWVGTDKGLYKFDETLEQLSLVNADFTGSIRDICIDKEGSIWVISNLVLYKGVKISRSYCFQKQITAGVTSICRTPDGTMWFSSANGYILKHNALNNSFTHFDVFNKSKPSTSNRIEKVFSTGKGTILVGTTAQGAKIFDIPTGTYKDIITHYSDNTEVLAHDFVEQADNKYWIATDFGIFVYDLKTEKIINIRKLYNDPYSISDDAVHTLCKDKEGGIWAGTFFGGVNYYPKQYTSFKKYFPKTGENSISGNVVREIVEDREHNLWVGTEDAGLNKLNPKTGSFTHFVPTGNKKNLSFSTIFGLSVFYDRLWIGTYQHGLDIFDIKTARVVKHFDASKAAHCLKTNFITTFYKTHSGNILIGTSNGLHSYNNATKQFDVVDEVPEDVFIYSVAEDAEGTIWVTTKGNGVYYYDLKTKRRGNYRFEDNNVSSLSSNIVNTIFEDSDKNLWFTTEGGGLCRFNKDKKNFKRYTTKNRLPSNSIFKILEDDKKMLWMATSKGLVSFDPKTEEVAVYTKSDGLLSEQFTNSSGYKDSAGTMYFGSVKGLISFNPSEFRKNNYTPPVYITGFQINNQEVEINDKGQQLKASLAFTDKIKISYDQSSFSVDFAALSFTSPEKTEYAYKMEGLETNWTYLKTKRKAYFTNLSPGLYTFKVKASVNGSSWNALETKITIEITPPFWRTSWAFMLYTAISALAILFIICNQKRKAAEKNRRSLELLKHEHEKEIYNAKFDFFTNIAHEIRTPLTLIKGPMEMVIEKADKVPEIKKYLTMMDKNTNRLVDLTNELLDFRKVETKGFSLNFARQDVAALLEEIYSRFKLTAQQKGLNYTISVQQRPVYAYIDAEAFNKILANLITNAIKYGESKVEISLCCNKMMEKSFSVIIKNDGHIIPYGMKDKIFETFYRLKETEKLQGTGIGLALSRTLTQLHKGNLELQKPENNMNVFILTLPINQEVEVDIEN